MKTPKNILLVTLDGGGNLPPVLATAKGLAAAGHHVTVLSEPCMEQPVKSSGLQFIPFTQHYTRNNRNEDLIRDANTTFSIILFSMMWFLVLHPHWLNSALQPSGKPMPTCC